MGIHSVHIYNFKSIRDSGEIKIKPLNVLIGSNGSGKSNFISFFKFLNMLSAEQLQNHIARSGRAEGILYFGKYSENVSGTIIFRNDDNKISNRYKFTMEPDRSSSLFFVNEYSDYNMQARKSNLISWDSKKINQGGTLESQLKNIQASTRTSFLVDFFETFKVFHFHDTSENSKLKGFCNVSDNEYLIEDGSNLPAFLYRMQEMHPKHFQLFVNTVKSVAPFIDSFYLKPDAFDSNKIELRWKEKGHDNIFNSYSLSDGTLRFISLCTLLIQPNPPSTIIIDEPELGLHPFAISKLGSLLQNASQNSQLIISTQSINLIDQFSPDDILVVDRKDGQSVFNRQSEEDLKDWLLEYSLGELWQKNVLGGRPK